VPPVVVSRPGPEHLEHRIAVWQGRSRRRMVDSDGHRRSALQRVFDELTQRGWAFRSMPRKRLPLISPL
jgi:hypothetical protein